MTRTSAVVLTLAVITLTSAHVCAKDGRTLTDPDWLAKFRADLAAGEEAAVKEANAARDRCKWWMEKDDEYLWNWLPDLKAPRIVHVSFKGCPICGKQIFEGRGHYPWIWDPEKPYKVKCPICETIFPTNDYHKWMLEGRKEPLDSTQKYVDDGDGYVAPDGEHYYFVGYAIGMGYKSSIWPMTCGRGIPYLARAYLLTGDEAYAHKCAVLMAKIATEYPSLNPDRPDDLTEEEMRRLEYPTSSSQKKATIGGYQTEAPYTRNAFKAYDDIYPYLAQGGDPELRQLLAAKGIEYVKTLIEWDYLHELLLGALEGNFVSGHGILGLHRCLASAAVAWDMHEPARGATTEYLLDWILHSGPNCMDEWLYNYFDRDGFGPCEGLGYNFSGGVYEVGPLAETLKSAGVDILQIPRIQEVMSLPIKAVVAGEWYPSIGDGGSWKGYRADKQRYYREAFARLDGQPSWASRNYSPFGLAIFESGEGELRRGVSCYYGGNTAHGHFDRLTFSLFNHRGPVTPELGYPHMGSVDRGGWHSNTSSHNTVVVNARKQLNVEPGYLTLFALTPTAQALEVGGEVAYRGIVSRYRRTLIWVDVDEANSYLVDIFRVAGGSQHDYSLHGPSAEVSVEGIALARQATGTLAGPDVAHLQYYDGEASEGGYKGSGYQYLFNVEGGGPTEGFVATWAHRQEGTPFLRVHVPAGNARQVFFADGLPPFGKPEDALRYMFLRNGQCPPLNEQEGEEVGDLESTFVTVLEPLLAEPFVTRVKRLSGVEGLGPGDVALSVERADGARDLIVCLEMQGEVTGAGVSMKGRIGLCTTAGDGAPTRMALLDGTSLSCGGASIEADGPLEGEIGAVDYEAMTLTVPERLPAGDQLAGQHIIFTTPPRTACFVIASVEAVPKGSRIKLRDLDAVAFRGKIERASNEESVVVLDSPISIHHAGTALAGMRLCNEDGSGNTRIESFQRRWDPNTPWPPFGGTAQVEGGFDLEQAFRDLDGDGTIKACVYEFGPGDPYRIASTAYLGRNG